jgi:hypothetical protein
MKAGVPRHAFALLTATLGCVLGIGRALRLRWEKTAANCLALVQLACSLICIQGADR